MLWSLREQHPEAVVTGGKGQKYLKNVAENESCCFGALLLFIYLFSKMSQSSVADCLSI